ncbi:hypothetical protein CLV30_11313 [Haloactinopolyspora alba]|uniref:Uncharacterized protein n=1 Tax=Haloactinopolyspora alba TaxID=648780 RepID=A0A2P8DWC8_9ACTN|nr:hypothetical protein [Haloactinopolyspora alba]PSL01525.1 hypothetical protein CLV30_11313 [Haloactinopolyspora alba]
MSSSDDVHEMRRHRLDDDTAVETLLSGEAVPPGLEPLSGAVREIRSEGTGCPDPTPELAERMATGDFAGIQPAGSGADQGRRRWWPRVSAWRPRTRVVTGVVAAFTGFTGVAAAGALPDGAQRSVESFIESVSPITFRDRSGEVADVEETETPSPADASPLSGHGSEPDHETSDDTTDTPARNPGTFPPGVGRPDTPDRPETPPREPDTPDRPETPPREPDTPNRPETPPREPDTPNRPETPPEEPDTPNRPETPPEEPDTPNRPDTPPGQPEDPGSNAEERQPDGSPGEGNEGNPDRNQPDQGNPDSGNRDSAPEGAPESKPGDSTERGEPGDTSDNGNSDGSASQRDGSGHGDGGSGAGNGGSGDGGSGDDTSERPGTSANARGR